ncbi:MAG: hypothetical protein IIC54_00290 [Proteobacteria bacterium]|nr:hypothetical protein [Pseudomonadota bacterium]MCH8212489.1 hypothetical protein [Pseudomonadota bacterium]
MNGDLQRLAQEVGELKGRLGAVEEATRDQHGDIKIILKTLNEARGGWKTLLLIAGLSTAFGALGAKLIALMGVLPR